MGENLLEMILGDTAQSFVMMIWVAFVVKSLLVSGYACALYLAVSFIKKLLGGRLGARGGYYCWYALLLAFPLSGLDFNAWIKIPVYELYAFNPSGFVWGLCCALALLWLLVVLYRLESQIITFVKLEGAIAVMREAGLGGLKRRAAEAFGLNADKIRVVTASWVNSPVSYGFFRKTVLLPQEFESRYSEDELYLLLLHEMAHIKNGDTAKLHFISFIQCLFPLPPGFVKQFKLDTEILCDNRVIGVERDQTDSYGDLLVKESMCKSSPIKGLAFSDSFSAFERRVDAIFDIAPQTYRYSSFALAVFIMLAASLGRAYAAPAAWYSAAYPDIPKYDILVHYEDDDFERQMNAYHDYYLQGGPPYPYRGPGKELFDGIWTIANDELIIDKLALYDIMKSLDGGGAKPVSVSFIFHMADLTSEHPSIGSHQLYMAELENQEGINEYIGSFFPREKHLYSFLAHWM